MSDSIHVLVRSLMRLPMEHTSWLYGTTKASPTYEALRERVGLVVHNAWPVNFNLPLTAFRPQLAGLVNLFALAAAAAPRTLRVLFVSSVGAGLGAAEEVLDDFDKPVANGYSRSKFLSEILCDKAARHLGVPVTIARVGQVAGPERRPAVWNRAEGFPSLVVSSLGFGCLPNSLGPQFSLVDWVPADLLAEVMVDLAGWSGRGGGDGAGAAVFNLRNPKTTTWGALVPAIMEVARDRLGRSLEVVPSSAWLDRLQKAAADSDGGDLMSTATSNPAIKLVSFYSDELWANQDSESKPMLVERAMEVSSTLRGMSPVGIEWMRKWVNEWISAQLQDGEVR